MRTATNSSIAVTLALVVACTHRPREPLGPIAQPECAPPKSPLPVSCEMLSKGRTTGGCPTYDELLSDLLKSGKNKLACPYGVREGVCGAFTVIGVPGRFGGRDFYFDAAGGLVGWVAWNDIVVPCDFRALDPDYSGPVQPGVNMSTEWGRVPRCTGHWVREHCQ